MSERRGRIDFAVGKPGEGIQLLVEAKNTNAPTRDWASRFLRNLFAHTEIPRSEYFLLALRDHLYLWLHPEREPKDPDYEIDTAAALRPYLGEVKGSLEKLSESSFELVMLAWLNDLVAGTLPDAETRHWVESSGLAKAVRNSSIRTNLAA